MSWQLGDRLTHRFNPELGPGRVVSVDGRNLEVEFPKTGATLRYSSRTDALEPLQLRPGTRVQLIESPDDDAKPSSTEADEIKVVEKVIERMTSEGLAVLDDGREVDPEQLWPVDSRDDVLERLITGDVDSRGAFRVRAEATRLEELRQIDDLGSFLGGRIRLFPHQLHVAERATRADPVRWLLADEVGLGKTVESCLILNHLLHTGRAERTLVVAPESLTVQWLGELWRKYHQVFVLLDDKRLRDVERDYGEDFNPFDAHHQVVVSQELLEERPRLTELACNSGLDLLIVDEAHHLRRPPKHPGDPSYRAVAPIAAAVRHTLLLTAIPLEDDSHGFFRLLQLLRPDELPDFETFEELLENGKGLPGCTSATRRVDIGGLPPRVGRAVELEQGTAIDEVVKFLQRETTRGTSKKSSANQQNPLARRAKARRIRRALASPAALQAILTTDEAPELDPLLEQAAKKDPRIDWILEQAPSWLGAGDKTLIFVAHRETLDSVKKELNRRAHLRAGIFHEDLSTKQRDVEVAQFRAEGGPPILISTECGGEGRNFEFCRRLVLFDMPWSPLVVEQRIGRLDRIGRKDPVEIVYFRPRSGLGAVIARLYEQLGVLQHPMSGLEHELGAVEPAIESLALDGGQEPDPDHFAGILEQASTAYDRVQEAAYHQLHRDPYRPEMAAEILGRIPPELEDLTRHVVLGACNQLGLHVTEHQLGSRHSIGLDSRARIESLPGIIGEATFLGTFSRERAVENEQLDFFSFGHPIVEGLLAHLGEDPLGRAALLRIPADGIAPGFGLLGLFPADPGFHAVAVDGKGKERPEWAAALLDRANRGERVRTDDWVSKPSWPRVIRQLAKYLEPRGRPIALAFFRIG